MDDAFLMRCFKSTDDLNTEIKQFARREG
jgi:hypothetical protein